MLCFHPNSHWLNVLCSQTWTPAMEEGCSIWLREEPANSSATLKTTWRTPWWTPPTRLWIKWPRKYGWSYPGCHQERYHKQICCLYFPSSVNSMEHWMERGSTQKVCECYIWEVYVHFEAHIVRTIGSDVERPWITAWVTFKRILHALFSFFVNAVRSDRLLQPWMGFKTILQGRGQRGRRQSLARPLCVGAQASAPEAQRRFCITRNTCIHGFSLTIDSASLIVMIPPPCFSSPWPSRSFTPASLHLNYRFSPVVELFMGLCSAKWPVLSWYTRGFISLGFFLYFTCVPLQLVHLASPPLISQLDSSRFVQ